MRINSPARYGTVIFLVIQLTGFHVARGFFDLQEFDQRCMALFRVMNYLVQRPQQINVDGLFGITLAEANLLATLHHPNAQFLAPQYRGFITNVLRFFERARLQIKINVLSENRDVALMNAILNEPILWIRSIVWKQGALGKRPEPTLGLNRSTAEESIYRGTPQENESDHCIGELIRDKLQEHCKVSDYCAEMLLRRDDPAGYPLTHRLLYVQTARSLKCQEHRSVSFVKLIPTYCEAILQNLVDIEVTEFPGVSRDLAIEQVLLCGMEGFKDFANDYYAKMFRGWIHPAGCYNSRGFDNSQDSFFNSSLRTKDSTRRSAGLMDFGCDNHASGLAAGTLALFVRESVENAFHLPLTYDVHKNERTIPF